MTQGSSVTPTPLQHPPAVEPPLYAWDWFGRQRLAWREVRDRLAAIRAGASATPMPHRRPPDVPDWAPDVAAEPRGTRRAPPVDPHEPAAERIDLPRDYAVLDTRLEVVAALREDYPNAALVRATVDTVVAERAFVGRLDVRLVDRGVRAAPRGMRWWWQHLGGIPDATIAPGDRDPTAPSGTSPRDEGEMSVPPQLRLFDVQAGYGDGLVRDDARMPDR